MKALVFAGTTEGKEITKFLLEKNYDVVACVATEYGQEILSDFSLKNHEASRKLTVKMGRMNPQQMADFMINQGKKELLVIDATHPYADLATKNIKEACSIADKKYIRLLRTSDLKNHQYLAKNQSEVVEYANLIENIEKKILLTTGSKDLEYYTKIVNYRERVYIRILPDLDSLKNAINCGYKKSNIICMQGPFSLEMNSALIKSTRAQILVTKDTGNAGGFGEKIEACKENGTTALVIKRPENIQEDCIMTLEEVKRVIDPKYISKDPVNLESKSNSDQNFNPQFPIFVNLNNIKVVVVGAGNIAKRRIETLIKFGADIVVVSPEFKTEIIEASKKPENNIKLIKKNFEEGDLEGALLCISATSIREVNHRVYLEATKLQIPASIADCKEECTYYFPAIVQSDNINIGIVSDGTDHKKTARIAGKLREYLTNHKQ